MKKTRLLSCVLIAVLLASLCACAGGGRRNETPAPSPPLGSAAQTETPPSAQGNTSTQPSTLPSTPSTPLPTTPAQPPGDGGNTVEPTAPLVLSGEVTITFEFVRQTGPASNQYAVWIEDADGRLVKSLYASRWTADGGYRTRPDSIALWAEIAGLASMPKPEVDAVSGATPQTGIQTHTWDLTDGNGDIVSPGEYIIYVEGTLRWKNYVLYSGVIELGSTPVTVQAVAQFVYEASDRYDALTSSSPENAMIGSVTVSFTQGGY